MINKKEGVTINKSSKSTFGKIAFYTCCFFIYCTIGWIYEVIWEAAIGNGFVNRGFLHGFYLPIYGFGFLILHFLLDKLMHKKIKIGPVNITPIIVFLAILLIVSTFEFLISWVMEILFHKRWWDYSTDILNINGRVCLRNSTILASGGMIMLYGIQPILQKILPKIKPTILKVTALLIMCAMMTDFIIVMSGYIYK